MLAETMASMQ